MNARSLDTRLCGCRAHGGSEARQVALEFHRQAFVRRTLNSGDGLRHRVVAVGVGAPSDALLAERDQRGVASAGGGGCSPNPQQTEEA